MLCGPASRPGCPYRRRLLHLCTSRNPASAVGDRIPPRRASPKDSSTIQSIRSPGKCEPFAYKNASASKISHPPMSPIEHGNGTRIIPCFPDVNGLEPNVTPSKPENMIANIFVMGKMPGNHTSPSIPRSQLFSSFAQNQYQPLWSSTVRSRSTACIYAPISGRNIARRLLRPQVCCREEGC